MVGLSFHGVFWNFPVNGEYTIKILAIKFLAKGPLYCYYQVAKIVTFTSDFSVYYKNAFVKPKRKKLHVKIELPKLQETLLYDTKRDAQLEPCIAPSAPTFQHCPRLN